jgi:type IV/VI secretion system ImpK/VasF family protein
MTPLFAQHVDPILLSVFDVLESTEVGRPPSVEGCRREINQLIYRAERGLGSGQDWKHAKYALVYWTDELLVNVSNWSEPAKTWELLEWEHFSEAKANEYFYVHAAETVDHPGLDDALETYYVCFMLGFRGLYRPEERESLELAAKKWNVPHDLSLWAGGLANVIQQRREIRASAVEDRRRDRPTIVPARPLWRWEYLLWPWLLSLLLLCCVIVYPSLKH